jgi:hypothetical protein
MSDLKTFATCTKQCAESESKCNATNASVQGAPAICSGQNALCMGSCADSKSSSMSKAEIAWIIVFVIIGAALLVWLTLMAVRKGYIRKLERKFKKSRGKRSGRSSRR